MSKAPQAPFDATHASAARWLACLLLGGCTHVAYASEASSTVGGGEEDALVYGRFQASGLVFGAPNLALGLCRRGTDECEYVQMRSDDPVFVVRLPPGAHEIDHLLLASEGAGLAVLDTQVAKLPLDRPYGVLLEAGEIHYIGDYVGAVTTVETEGDSWFEGDKSWWKGELVQAHSNFFETSRELAAKRRWVRAFKPINALTGWTAPRKAWALPPIEWNPPDDDSPARVDVDDSRDIDRARGDLLERMTIDDLHLRLLGQPRVHPDHVYLLVDPADMPADCVDLALDSGTRDLRLPIRHDADRVFATIELAVLEDAAAKNQVAVDLCGQGGRLSPTQLAAVRRFTRQFRAMRSLEGGAGHRARPDRGTPR